MHRERTEVGRLLGLVALTVASALGPAGCNSAALEMSSDRAGDGSVDNAHPGYDGDANEPNLPSCTSESCGPGFHCEYDACVPDSSTSASGGGGARDPVASSRYVFTLEVASRRLVRIDSLTLEVAAFAAGLAPMDLAVVGSRELTVLLDALDLVEVLDHRQKEPRSAAWSTARSLSHVALSPTGLHAVAYYDWDDPRAQERQPQPGNINQVSVLYLGDEADGFTDEQPRNENVAVGFLPRDVRFSADGTRAVVVGRDTLTPIALGTTLGAVATPQSSVPFDGSAAEILVDSSASLAIVRYGDTAQVDVISLDDGSVRCFDAAAPVTDIALLPDDRVLLSATVAGEEEEEGEDAAEDAHQMLALLSLADATAESCATVPTHATVTDVTRLTVDPAGDLAIAYEPVVDVETAWQIDLSTLQATALYLEKAVAAVAFAGDGRFALLSHLKAEGTPAWDPLVEDPDVSVDKSHGVTWLDLQEGSHRLEVSNDPFGPFVFVPGDEDGPGATFQAVLDEREPRLLRVSHRPGFHDQRIDLAALPLQMGFLDATAKTYVTQNHPWGRVTFVDTLGEDLRHVTGFALALQ